MEHCICPKCKQVARLVPSVSPGYQKIECYGHMYLDQRKIGQHFFKFSKLCKYKGFVKIGEAVMV